MGVKLRPANKIGPRKKRTILVAMLVSIVLVLSACGSHLVHSPPGGGQVPGCAKQFRGWNSRGGSDKVSEVRKNIRLLSNDVSSRADSVKLQKSVAKLQADLPPDCLADFSNSIKAGLIWADKAANLVQTGKASNLAKAKLFLKNAGNSLRYAVKHTKHPKIR